MDKSRNSPSQVGTQSTWAMLASLEVSLWPHEIPSPMQFSQNLTKLIRSGQISVELVRMSDPSFSKVKSSFVSNLVTESPANPRTLWRTLNTILLRNPTNSLPESPDAFSLVNTYLDFFEDKIDRIRTKFLPSHSLIRFFSTCPASKADQFYSSHSHKLTSASIWK